MERFRSNGLHSKRTGMHISKKWPNLLLYAPFRKSSIFGECFLAAFVAPLTLRGGRDAVSWLPYGVNIIAASMRPVCNTCLLRQAE